MTQSATIEARKGVIRARAERVATYPIQTNLEDAAYWYSDDTIWLLEQIAELERSNTDPAASD